MNPSPHSMPRRVLARSGKMFFCCLLALGTARCMNGFTNVDYGAAYGNGTGLGTRTNTTPLGRDPDTVEAYSRARPAAGIPAALLENTPGPATAN